MAIKLPSLAKEEEGRGRKERERSALSSYERGESGSD